MNGGMANIFTRALRRIQRTLKNNSTVTASCCRNHTNNNNGFILAQWHYWA